ncbi:MAG: ankyrin repeat domain-containing protein, partial [Desulfobacterales bacterium]
MTEDLGRYKRKIVILITLLMTTAAYLSVHIYFETTMTRRDDLEPTGAKSRTESIPAGQMHQSLFNQQVINEGRISKTTEGADLESAKINIDVLKKTNLTLRLWGTITGNNIRASAIIEETTTGKQKLCREGDVILNATVEMIFREKVVLSVDDNYEILEIETKQADVNAKDKYGVTALIAASFKGQKEIVELLIIEGADLNAQDNKGDTALMNAAIKGHSEIAELLITNGADVHVRDNLGNTALIDSAKYARETTCEVIAVLIDSGADVNVKNKYGVTALMNAAQWGHID